jgi:hypothetical protein
MTPLKTLLRMAALLFLGSESAGQYSKVAPTLSTTISGVGTAYFVHSASAAPLTSWSASSSGATTTYNVFAVGWGTGNLPALGDVTDQ